jgi:hypothetical protein
MVELCVQVDESRLEYRSKHGFGTGPGLARPWDGSEVWPAVEVEGW